ncbi:MAG: flagellar protein FlgN [Pseudomonadota bacterium]
MTQTASTPADTSAHAVKAPLPATLRQMIAVLEDERQALATLDADGLFEAARDKGALCDTLALVNTDALDAETRPLVETAQRLNDVNRRVRNLLAANVASRLEALGAPRVAYQAGQYTRPGALSVNP